MKVIKDLCDILPPRVFIDANDEDLTDLNSKQGKNNKSLLKKFSTELIDETL
jgi:hypothetical protein